MASKYYPMKVTATCPECSVPEPTPQACQCYKYVDHQSFGVIKAVVCKSFHEMESALAAPFVRPQLQEDING